MSNNFNDLKIKLLSVIHSGKASHFGITSTIDALNCKFILHALAEETTLFVNDCFLSIISKSRI